MLPYVDLSLSVSGASRAVYDRQVARTRCASGQTLLLAVKGAGHVAGGFLVRSVMWRR